MADVDEILPNHPRFDPTLLAIRSNPYPYYEWLRRTSPVHFGVSGDPRRNGCWYVTRFHDVNSALRDPRLSSETVASNESALGDKLFEATKHWMFMRDPPTHSRMRSLVASQFMQRPIAARRKDCVIAAEFVLNRISRLDSVDLVNDVAMPLAVINVTRKLGVPTGDSGKFYPWTQALSRLIEFEKCSETFEDALVAVAEMELYLNALIECRRESASDDLTSYMLGSLEEGKATRDELVGTLTQLLFGGNEPVKQFIVLAVRALVDHPEQTQSWLGGEINDRSAIDELLRYDGPVQLTQRVARQSFDLHGERIREGDQVALVFGSANHDHEQFDDPETLRLSRFPNRHLGFGGGIHTCIGASLLRELATCFLVPFFQRYPQINIPDQEFAWTPGVAVRGFERLMINLN